MRNVANENKYQFKMLSLKKSTLNWQTEKKILTKKKKIAKN